MVNGEVDVWALLLSGENRQERGSKGVVGALVIGVLGDSAARVNRTGPTIGIGDKQAVQARVGEVSLLDLDALEPRADAVDGGCGEFLRTAIGTAANAYL